MRQLTFPGFLQRSLKELTGTSSRNLAVLTKLAASSYPRAAEPLFMLVLAQAAMPHLLKEAQGTHLEEQYYSLSLQFQDYNALFAALERKDKRLPERYHKIYDSFISKSERIVTNRNASCLMRDKTVVLMQQKGLSTYRIYTDLGLNPGNINAFIKHSDPTKVSRKTARAILRYAESA